tara:strand:+ start:1870 stop:2550 length:681 start_codon:yes stop_codon:yes gene_type:complete
LAKNKNLIYIGVGALIGATALFFVLRAVLVKYRVIRVAKREWEGWGKPLIGIDGKQIRGKTDLEEGRGFVERVAKYWREGTGLKYDGSDTDKAWSSAFISYIMKKGGAGDKFVYNQAHSKYIRDSIANRKQGKFNAPFVGYRINEVAPKVGDLVCYHREDSNSDFYDRTGDYKSHCDLVVKKDKNQLEVIGGNVNDAVTKRIVRINSKGLVADRNRKWFAVIKTNI